jgi:MFS family permease
MREGSFLAPRKALDEATRDRGLVMLTREVVFSTTCDSLVGGVIVTAFALHLGASNEVIGAIAALTFWRDLLQGPAVMLVQKVRARKAIAVVGSLVSATAPLLMLGLAFSGASDRTHLALIAIIALYGGASAFAGCAWSGWVRDMVPDDRRGRFFGRRSTLGTVTALVAGLCAAWLLEQTPEGSADRAAAFAGLFGLAFLAQLLSAAALARVPEPMMPPAGAAAWRLIPMLREVWADEKFRSWIRFLANWKFAVNLAQPFFTVFFLTQLGFGMAFVMALSLITQFATLLTLARWGQLADRFKDKSVLNVAAPTFILCIAGMILASQFESKTYAGAYLVLLHLVMGVASAGVSLATGNMIMKISPRGASESYLAANALISSVAAGLAPLIGGFCAEFFASREFALTLQWVGPNYQGEFARLSLRAWDFYFLLSALYGLYALHRLGMVHEEGELMGRQMLRGMHQRAQEASRRLLGFGVGSSGDVEADLEAAAEMPRPSRRRAR